MEITRTLLSAITLFWTTVVIGSSNSETLFICRYPEKGFSCTLTCVGPKTLNVVFLKKNGSLSGEGGCLMSIGCKSRNPRYEVSQDLNETYLRITELNRTEDEGEWHCEHGDDKSTFKTLTVYTRMSNLHIRKVPEKVNKRFTLIADGHCVYPNITNATLEPSLSHHVPKIDYIPYPEKCGKDEYKVRISFMINPSDFTGVVKFRVKVKENGINMSFVSTFSTPVNFQGLNCNCPRICKPGLSFILLLLFLFFSFGIYWFFGIHKKILPQTWKYRKCTILRILGAGAIACLVLSSILAFSLASVNYDDKNCKVSECLCSSCTCVINSIILGLVGLVEVVLTIVILFCFTIRKQDKKGTDTEFQNSSDNTPRVSAGEDSPLAPLNEKDNHSTSNVDLESDGFVVIDKNEIDNEEQLEVKD